MAQERALSALPLSAEQQVRLLDSLNQALIATDRAGIIVFCNEAARGLYAKSLPDVLGHSIDEIATFRLAHKDDREVRSLLLSGRTWTGELDATRYDGTTIVVEMTTVPIENERGEVSIIVGLSRDITGVKELELEREHLIEETRAISRSKDEFLALVSHELRTPVTTILGFAELITRKPRVLDEETVFDSLVDMRDAARRLHRLVDDLLTLSRGPLVRSQWQVELEPLSVERTLAAVIAEHRRQYPERRILLSSGEALLPAQAHQLYLEHALINLLSNAEKYSPLSESIEVNVERSGEEIVVGVLDRGYGIPEGERDRIFDSFYRSSRTEHLQGAGLGLAVCKRLMEVQKGRIWYESRDGGGSIFRVALPVTHLPLGDARGL